MSPRRNVVALAGALRGSGPLCVKNLRSSLCKDDPIAGGALLDRGGDAKLRRSARPADRGGGPRRCMERCSPTSKPFRGTSLRPPGAVVEVNHAAVETTFVQQVELQADIVGQGSLAASHHHRCDE